MYNNNNNQWRIYPDHMGAAQTISVSPPRPEFHQNALRIAIHLKVTAVILSTDFSTNSTFVLGVFRFFFVLSKIDNLDRLKPRLKNISVFRSQKAVEKLIEIKLECQRKKSTIYIYICRICFKICCRRNKL